MIRSLYLIFFKKTTSDIWFWKYDFSVSEAMETESHEEFAPEFAQKHCEHLADEGKNVELECKVLGRPMPNIHWLKDGQEIQQNENIQIRVKSESFLENIFIKN